ncbi:MAG: hypothetical protein CVU49_03890 [Candidatus Cloacimonetes bacterium HGW-Cloacimonetes-2]|jgi:hypothetical protein|nr:MAG: hypothetical protein CVU49_03890 [Candidatus Cloacimonetes bacterium HGW-Cloacimonetes-2]
MNKTTKTTSVFYSWQSDLDEKYNRYAIGDSLQEAKKRLKAKSICVDIDQATRGDTGAPDILETILKKINKSDVYVCDVTLINSDCKCSRDGKPLRKTPNPNVMFEFGYALRVLGWERILILIHSDYCSISELPFDISRRFTLSHNCNEQNRKDEVKRLSEVLTQQIQAIIAKNPTKPIIKDKMSEEIVRRDKDIKTLNEVLSTIHFPTLLHYVHEESPKYRSHMIVNMYHIIEGSLKVKHVHFYDDLLERKFFDLVKAIEESLAYVECFDYVTNSDRYVFIIPGDVFRSDEEEKKFEALNSSRIQLFRVLTDFNEYVMNRYIEIDLDKTNKVAYELLRSCTETDKRGWWSKFKVWLKHVV